MRRMFLNGTAMSGERDHAAVASATFLGPARTATRYRFVAVDDSFPGLLPVEDGGFCIHGELYEMTEPLLFDGLLPEEPPELELGTIELADGTIVNSMQLQSERIRSEQKVVDISEIGSWRAYRRFVADNVAIDARLDRR